MTKSPRAVGNKRKLSLSIHFPKVACQYCPRYIAVGVIPLQREIDSIHTDDSHNSAYYCGPKDEIQPPLDDPNFHCLSGTASQTTYVICAGHQSMSAFAANVCKSLHVRLEVDVFHRGVSNEVSRKQQEGKPKTIVEAGFRGQNFAQRPWDVLICETALSQLLETAQAPLTLQGSQ